MSCIPISGGCERHATDALVAHINWAEGTHYEYRACLDRIDASRKQPECLYVNIDDNRRMVIERKSIMWPDTYAYEHSKEHDLANAIKAGLAEIDFQDIYLLQMPVLRSGSKKELTAIGLEVAAAIRLKYAYLKQHEALSIHCKGHRFEFSIQPFEDRDGSGPDKGLCMSWTAEVCLLQPADLPDKLRPQVEKMYAGCVLKFADYSNDRRVLMLDPHGDVCFNSPHWWNAVFAKYNPPSEIDEIWIGSSGDDGFGDEDWIVEKVFGGNIVFPERLALPIAVE